MPPTTLTKRVNLRLEEDTYEAYEKVASFFNRSVADLMRDALDGGVTTMHALGAMIDQAKAGDAEAVQRLFDAMMRMHQGTLDVARETLAAQSAAADRTSNTVR